MATKPTIAFFGATGGSTIPALARSLEAGYTATALARTPSKLVNSLVTRGVPRSALDSLLTVHEGNVKDQSAVQKAIVIGGRLVDLIVSGVGGVLNPSLFNPTLDDPSICADAMRTLLAAIEEVQREVKGSSAARKPIVCAISTTGISSLGRDIPVLMIPMYHWLLQVPHADKKNMENLLLDTKAKSEQSPIRGFVIVRPSFLSDREGKGTNKLRVGWEDERETHAEIGYTIAREDVGTWIFEEFVNSSEGRRNWTGKMVTLTE